jgi:hypothetical protein
MQVLLSLLALLDGGVEHQVRSLLALLVHKYLLYRYKSTTVVMQMRAEASTLLALLVQKYKYRCSSVLLALLVQRW